MFNNGTGDLVKHKLDMILLWSLSIIIIIVMVFTKDDHIVTLLGGALTGLLGGIINMASNRPSTQERVNDVAHGALVSSTETVEKKTVTTPPEEKS